MSEDLENLFNHHTKMRDALVKDLYTFEFDKFPAKDLYMIYRLGLQSFMDPGFPLFDFLYRNASPAVAARLQKLRESDETVLYFVPFYNYWLWRDFAEFAPLFSKEIVSNYTQAWKAYNDILVYFCRDVLKSYVHCYSKESDEVQAKEVQDIYHDVETDFLVYVYCDNSKGKAENLNEAEGYLVYKLMKKILATDDEETRFFLNLYVTAFSSNHLYMSCKTMRGYYAKVWEIKEAVG